MVVVGMGGGGGGGGREIGRQRKREQKGQHSPNTFAVGYCERKNAGSSNFISSQNLPTYVLLHSTSPNTSPVTMVFKSGLSTDRPIFISKLH